MRQSDAEQDLHSGVLEASDNSMTPKTQQRKRLRVSLTQESPRARVRRLLVLIGRFNAMAVPSVDSARLLEPLRGILNLACEAFESEACTQEDDRRGLPMTSE
jgi:hypothetical protein